MTLQVGLLALSEARLSDGFRSSSRACISSFSRRGLSSGGGLCVPLESRTPGLWAPLGSRSTGRRRTPLCWHELLFRAALRERPRRLPAACEPDWEEEFQPLMRAASLPISVASPGGASSPRGAYCQTVVSKSTSIQSG